MSESAKPPKKSENVPKRSRVSQSDVPANSLKEALRVATAIFENYAGKPASPLDVAAAMEMSPTSSTFKVLTGTSIAYGLTEGGYNASTISITSISSRILGPLEEGAELIAKREAFMKPRIIGEFLKHYDGKQIPKPEIAANVLVAMGCPRDRTSDVFSLIMRDAVDLNLVRDIKGKQFANLSSQLFHFNEHDVSDSNFRGEEGDFDEIDRTHFSKSINTNDTLSIIPNATKKDNKRVFITHGKNKQLVDPIKRLLIFGEMEPVVSVESQSVSQPVPEKVMADMRSCSAAIIHVAEENVLIDKEANEHIVINPNVLIEIGAAMALYARRFILLVKDGVKLPSNLQGLYEVRYSSDQLDGDATIRLMEAIRALKAQPVVN